MHLIARWDDQSKMGRTRINFLSSRYTQWYETAEVTILPKFIYISLNITPWLTIFHYVSLLDTEVID